MHNYATFIASTNLSREETFGFSTVVMNCTIFTCTCHWHADWYATQTLCQEFTLDVVIRARGDLLLFSIFIGQKNNMKYRCQFLLQKHYWVYV